MTTYAFPITTTFYADGTVTVAGATVPVNTTLPTSTGTPQVGVAFTFTRGVWSGSPTSYTEQVNAAGTPISGATSLTYTPVAGDVGKTLTLTENATNGAGSGTAVTSAATPAVIAAGAAAFLWSNTDKSAQVVISNSQHTATHTGTANKLAAVRGTVSKSAGQWHFEVTADHVASAGPETCAVGLANASAGLTDPAWPGQNNNGITWWDDGKVYMNDVQVATWPTFASGNLLTIEFDEGAKTIKGKVGSGAYTTALSYSALTGAVFPVCIVYNGTDAFTAVVPTQTISAGYSVLS